MPMTIFKTFKAQQTQNSNAMLCDVSDSWQLHVYSLKFLCYVCYKEVS